MIERNRVLPKTSGVYQIKSRINEKIYIGSAVDFMKRKREHWYNLKNRNHCNRYLQRHHDKYGIKDLWFKIMEFCPKEKLIEREQYYMDILKPEFNICLVAGSSLGVIFTEERKQKFRGKNNPMYGIHRIGKEATNFGNCHTEKAKRKMSESHKGLKGYWLGKTISEETKQKMREAHKNRIYAYKASDETKRKMSLANIGKHSSDETKRKMSESKYVFYETQEGKELKAKLSKIHKGRTPWNTGKHLSVTTRKKISDSMKGKLHSEQYKQKMSNYKKEYWIKRKQELCQNI